MKRLTIVVLILVLAAVLSPPTVLVTNNSQTVDEAQITSAVTSSSPPANNTFAFFSQKELNLNRTSTGPSVSPPAVVSNTLSMVNIANMTQRSVVEMAKSEMAARAEAPVMISQLGALTKGTVMKFGTVAGGEVCNIANQVSIDCMVRLT